MSMLVNERNAIQAQINALGARDQRDRHANNRKEALEAEKTRVERRIKTLERAERTGMTVSQARREGAQQSFSREFAALSPEQQQAYRESRVPVRPPARIVAPQQTPPTPGPTPNFSGRDGQQYAVSYAFNTQPVGAPVRSPLQQTTVTGMNIGFLTAPPERPPYSSQYGYSTPEGQTQILYTNPTPDARSPTPTFAQQRRADREYAREQFRILNERGTAATPAETYAASFSVIRPVFTQTGRLVESQAQRGAAMYSGVPGTRPIYAGIESAGREFRMRPSESARTLVASYAVGAGAGYATRTIATPLLSRVAASRGIQTARNVRVAGEISLAGVAGGSLVYTGITSGAEGVGRVAPSFIAGGAGFSRGYGAGPGGQLQVSQGAMRISGVTRPTTRSITISAEGTVPFRVRQFGQTETYSVPVSVLGRGVRTGGPTLIRTTDGPLFVQRPYSRDYYGSVRAIGAGRVLGREVVLDSGSFATRFRPLRVQGRESFTITTPRQTVSTSPGRYTGFEVYGFQRSTGSYLFGQSGSGIAVRRAQGVTQASIGSRTLASGNTGVSRFKVETGESYLLSTESGVPRVTARGVGVYAVEPITYTRTRFSGISEGGVRATQLSGRRARAASFEGISVSQPYGGAPTGLFRRGFETLRPSPRVETVTRVERVAVRGLGRQGSLGSGRRYTTRTVTETILRPVEPRTPTTLNPRSPRGPGGIEAISGSFRLPSFGRGLSVGTLAITQPVLGQPSRAIQARESRPEYDTIIRPTLIPISDTTQRPVQRTVQVPSLDTPQIRLTRQRESFAIPGGSQLTFPPFVPPPIPPLPPLLLPGGGASGKGGSGKYRQSKRYTPSAYSVALNIRGAKPGKKLVKTGLSVRPIVVPSMKRRGGKRGKR